MKAPPAELLARLDHTERSKFPKAAMREIVARKDEMIPHLLGILESAHANPADYIDGPRAMLATYAAYLLAQFRETRAYRPLLALLHLEDGFAEQFFGDSITEDMHNIVACVFDGDEAPLRALIENPDADEYARACGGLKTYLPLMHGGRVSPADVERYFHDLLEHKLEREPSHIWNETCSLAGDLGFAELLPLIEKAFQEGLCDVFFNRFEHIRSRITTGGDPRWRSDCAPIDDTVGMMETWACFNPPPAPRRAGRQPNPLVPPLEAHGIPSRPVLPPPAKFHGVGRNEPCPCGSGRKFKKCCGAA
ncbi:MAG: DUF1186 domain-containing protein [Verrucomicrobiae bacterium]|nr:DUF1186 domain-containing protein [Verrucomicrobiae bacterium]